jgi:hypothetical protein
MGIHYASLLTEHFTELRSVYLRPYSSTSIEVVSRFLLDETFQ